MGCVNVFDPGGCGCGGCGCSPCQLPHADLTLSVVIVGHTTTCTLAYQGGCLWDTGCVVAAGVVNTSFRFDALCSGGCTYYRLRVSGANPTCTAQNSGAVYDTPANCSGLARIAGMTLASSACAPLHVVFNTIGAGGGATSATITP